MRIVKRTGLFETASSSVHALVVDKKPVSSSDFCKLYICHGDYGWGYDVYSTPSERASYLWQCVVSYSTPDEAKKKVQPLENILKRHYIDYEYEYEYFERDDENSWGPNDYVGGDVDHNDAAAWIVKELLADENKFLQFIFGNESCVVTGNDNGDEYGENMYEMGYADEEVDRWEDKYGDMHEYTYHKVFPETDKVWIYEKGN